MDCRLRRWPPPVADRRWTWCSWTSASASHGTAACIGRTCPTTTSSPTDQRGPQPNRSDVPSGMVCTSSRSPTRHTVRSRTSIKRRVIADLIRFGVAPVGERRDVRSGATFPVRLCLPLIGSARARLRAPILEALDIHSIGRYGEWKYSNMEDAILDGRAAADRLLGASGSELDEPGSHDIHDMLVTLVRRSPSDASWGSPSRGYRGSPEHRRRKPRARCRTLGGPALFVVLLPVLVVLATTTSTGPEDHPEVRWICTACAVVIGLLDDLRPLTVIQKSFALLALCSVYLVVTSADRFNPSVSGCNSASCSSSSTRSTWST